jgi:hypothetical protein
MGRMIPVYQTIIGNYNDKPPGNCWQANMASLFEQKLEDVPHFAAYGCDWADIYSSFVQSMGYQVIGRLRNPRLLKSCGNDSFDKIKNKEGVNGYFDAAVLSPKYFDPIKYITDPKYVPTTHAVIIDKDFNIVHDPNPNYKNIEKYPLADFIGYNGITEIIIYENIRGTI